MNHDPIYLNWEFWTAIVAALALVLSQLPPINQLVRGVKLTMIVYPRAGVGHKVGNPNMQLGVVLSNTGGRQANIKGIIITVLREGSTLATLPAQIYSPESDPTKQRLFVGFKINPNEDQNHNFNFFVDLPRNAERELRNKTLVLMNDINAKRAALGNTDKILAEADPVNVQPFHEMVSKNFIWIEGEYSINVRVESSDAKILVEKNFRFTLYESDSRQLRNYEAEYKYGNGIYYGSENQWLWIKISEG